uniref:LRRCT domain-containing protein n=1 Tax=Tetranychus urticae TaxID=32264 RepID=T1JRB4_TETUR
MKLLLSNRLRVFDVSFNPAISLMGQPLKGLTRLTNLLVKGVKLSFMGQSFFSNSSSELQMVDLSCNQLKSVPTQALSTTRKLIRLNLADNEIIKLNGDSFGKWSAKLLSLSLSKNGLQFISPDAFKNTVNLRELRLGFNNLLTTSSTYGQFLIPLRSSLTILELSYSIGSQLFSTLRSMVKLELLELDNNRLIDRDSLDNIKELTSLVHIDLEGNQLMSLPISLFNGSVHTKLRNIVVSSNKLVQIGGKTFNSLGQVVTIDLRGNQLTKLEETSFNNLPMLQTLILARNQLGSLDDRRIIVNCSNLVNLHLQENQLKFIDFSSFSDIRPTSLAAKNLSNPFGINLNVSHNQLSHIYVSEPNFDLIADFNVNGWVNGSETLISTTTSTTTVKPGKLVTPLPVTTPTLPDSAGNNATNETVPNEVNNNDDLSQEMNNNLPADQPIGIKRKVGLPIRSLDLSYNRLTEFNTNISKAIGGNLVTLNLNHNGLTSFPVDSNHSCCENLIFLDLSYNNITNIVPFGRIFSSMVNLMILDLSYNAINIIHPTIFNGTKVSKLNLKGNHLSSLTLLKPSSLPSTSSAHTPEYSPGQLIMDMNWPCFGISSTLVHLDLSDNHFYSIPSEIYSCQHLIHLNLQSNHLHQFHESLVFLSTLPKLRHLDLSYNPINGDFTSYNRKQLSLSTGGNKRETITFSALQYLHVQNCSLPTIPAIKSTHLIYLDVSHNVLYNISSSILSDIPNLLHLNLSFNELPVVPEELGLLRSLITLSLSGNPISNLDSSSFTPFKQLKTIDIRSLSLRYIDIRMFNSLKYLTDLATSTYPRVRSFRLADLLTKSLSLRSALIQVEEPILSHQIQWAFGSKLRQLIITGHQLKKILPDAFLGLHHRPDMVLRIVDTNISVLPTGLLRYLNDIRHITIDLRRNQLTQFNLDILQPIEATKSSFPFHVPFSSNGITLSGGLLLEDNPLICSCDITWLGSWLRKWLKETRKIHLLNHETFLSTESKARLMTYIGCNCCSTNLSLAQLFLLQYSVYLFMVGLS